MTIHDIAREAKEIADMPASDEKFAREGVFAMCHQAELARGYLALHDLLRWFVACSRDREDYSIIRVSREAMDKARLAVETDEEYRARFRAHLERASAKVATWPRWKRELLGGE